MRTTSGYWERKSRTKLLVQDAFFESVFGVEEQPHCQIWRLLDHDIDDAFRLSRVRTDADGSL